MKVRCWRWNRCLNDAGDALPRQGRRIAAWQVEDSAAGNLLCEVRPLALVVDDNGEDTGAGTRYFGRIVPRGRCDLVRLAGFRLALWAFTASTRAPLRAAAARLERAMALLKGPE